MWELLRGLLANLYKVPDTLPFVTQTCEECKLEFWSQSIFVQSRNCLSPFCKNNSLEIHPRTSLLLPDWSLLWVIGRWVRAWTSLFQVEAFTPLKVWILVGPLFFSCPYHYPKFFCSRLSLQCSPSVREIFKWLSFAECNNSCPPHCDTFLWHCHIIACYVFPLFLGKSTFCFFLLIFSGFSWMYCIFSWCSEMKGIFSV